VIVGDVSSGRVVLWNPAAERLFGYKADDAVGMPVEALVPDTLREDHRAGLRRFCQSGETRLVGTGLSAQLPALRADGSELWVELKLSPLSDAGVTGVFVLAVISDVTEQRRLHAQVIHQERLAAIGQLSSVLSHELRNPLSAALNWLFLARQELGGDVSDEVDGSLSMAERQLVRATSLIDDLLALVRPRAHTAAPVDLAEVVDEVLHATPPPQGVSVVVDLAPVSVMADGVQIAEVLTNLIVNAYEAVPDGGSLRVRAGVDGDMALVTVEDSGTGFDPVVVPRVFEPFFSTKSGGTGLGMAIVERLVHAHDGTVALENLDPIGARVVVRLPLRGPTVGVRTDR
jgi:PAS domain S-box-containing protein